MQILNIEQRSPEWELVRKGKITGTRLKNIVGTPKAREKCLYEVLAERIAVESDVAGEKSMERGVRLEPFALEEFEKITKKKVQQVGFAISDENEYIANSPDGLIKVGKKYKEAVEVKCPESATYLRYWLTNKIPEEYIPQVVQAFIVNSDLEILHFVGYDPRIEIHPIHIIKITRAELQETIDEYTEAQNIFLKEVEDTYKIIKKLVK